MTSGSFTYEALYDWEGGYRKNSPESLVRIHTTGSDLPANQEAVSVNLVGQDDRLDLFIRDEGAVGEAVKKVSLTGLNVFDKDIWYVSFGRVMPHDDEKITSRQEIFLRAAKQHAGEIIEYYQTSSHFEISADSVFTNITPTNNASGSFFVIGPQVFSGSSSSLSLIHI